jgi:hypothetical protein
MVATKFGLFSLLPLASAYWDLTNPKTDHSGRGVFEVDLVFPQEGTFAPTNVTPIIFAVQNPQRGQDLGAFIRWTLSKTSNTTRPSPYELPGKVQGGEIDLYSVNTSTISNPYLASDRMIVIGDIEDTWYFEWTIRYSNCSDFYTNRNTSLTAVEHGYSSYGINFTTQRTAPRPANLDTALSNDTCRVGDYLNLNVTMYGVLPGGGDDPYCSILGDPITEENRNCRISSDAKDSVRDEFAYLACMDTYRHSYSSNCTKPGEPRKTPAKPVVPSMAVRDMQVSMSWMFAALLGLGASML